VTLAYEKGDSAINCCKTDYTHYRPVVPYSTMIGFPGRALERYRL